jgi:hypothetical protein
MLVLVKLLQYKVILCQVNDKKVIKPDMFYIHKANTRKVFSKYLHRKPVFSRFSM